MSKKKGLTPETNPKEISSFSHNKDTNFSEFHVYEQWISENYNVRYNTILKEYQVQRKNSSKWELFNENSLYVTMNKVGIKISISKLIAVVKNPDYTKEYNPIKQYFDSLKDYDINEENYIKKLASYIDTDDNLFFLNMLTKWLCRVCKCSVTSGYYNKQALIFISRQQSTGKTTLSRWFCPPELSECLSENLNVENKDGLITVCSNFLINLDELSQLSKFNIRKLKSIFSLDFVKERLPYDRTATRHERIASFIGSSNEEEILTDDTGSIRWLCFELLNLDWNYSNDINVNDIWRQVKYLVNQNEFNFELTKEDSIIIEKRNERHQQHSNEYELLIKYAEKTDKREDCYFYTSSSVASRISQHSGVKLNNIAMGKALQKQGYKKIMHSKQKVYGYYLRMEIDNYYQ